MMSSNLFIRTTFRHAAVKQILPPSFTLPLQPKQSCREISSNIALISKVRRGNYLKTYPVLVVQSDGSTFNVRYHEPRAIIQLPLNVSTLTAEELQLRLAKRNPKKKIVYVKEEKDTYEASKYINLVRKAKKAAA